MVRTCYKKMFNDTGQQEHEQQEANFLDENKSILSLLDDCSSMQSLIDPSTSSDWITSLLNMGSHPTMQHSNMLSTNDHMSCTDYDNGMSMDWLEASCACMPTYMQQHTTCQPIMSNLSCADLSTICGNICLESTLHGQTRWLSKEAFIKDLLFSAFLGKETQDCYSNQQVHTNSGDMSPIADISALGHLIAAQQHDQHLANLSHMTSPQTLSSVYQHETALSDIIQQLAAILEEYGYNPGQEQSSPYDFPQKEHAHMLKHTCLQNVDRFISEKAVRPSELLCSMRRSEPVYERHPTYLWDHFKPVNRMVDIMLNCAMQFSDVIIVTCSQEIRQTNTPSITSRRKTIKFVRDPQILKPTKYNIEQYSVETFKENESMLVKKKRKKKGYRVQFYRNCFDQLKECY